MLDLHHVLNAQAPTPEHCYRVFRLDAQGRVDGAEVIHAVDDEVAIQMVRGLVGSRSLELWDRGRFIERFDPCCPLSASLLNNAA
jgi:hypothetical protein